MTRSPITLRTAEVREARTLYALIQANLEEGHLLPRTLDELVKHATRFVVAVKARSIVGCASRPSAQRSPKCDRSRSTARPAAAASA